MINKKMVIMLTLITSTILFTACGQKEDTKKVTTTKNDSMTTLNSENDETTEDLTDDNINNETSSENLTTPDDSTTKDENTTTKKEETTTKQPETTKKQETTTKQPETTKKQETTTKQPETTTKQPETTTKQPETTTKYVETTDITIVQEGCIYWQYVSDDYTDFGQFAGPLNYGLEPAGYIKLYAGSAIPTPSTHDVYQTKDYYYYYNNAYTSYIPKGSARREYKEGWDVMHSLSDKSSYEDILLSIGKKPITAMNGTFKRKSNLKNIPAIPATVECMMDTFAYSNITEKNIPTLPNSVRILDFCFYHCDGLNKTPNIPNGVTSLHSTFYYCKNLTTVSTIPSSVKYMKDTFWECTGLTGTIVIDASPTEENELFTGYKNCFYNVDFTAQNLDLSGKSTILSELRATGKN